MKRHVALIFAGVILLAVSAGAKTVERSDNGSEKSGAEGGMPTGWERPGLLKQIAIYEEAARKGETEHSPNGSLAKIYVQLASMYADLAMYPRAEEAIHRGIALLQQDSEPKEAELAAAMEDLAMLHITTGDLSKGEKEGRAALQIRLKLGDRAAIGASYRQMTTLYLKRQEFKKAVEFGQRGIDAIGDAPQANSDDWITVRFALARALCESGSYGRAIPLLQQGIEQAKIGFGEQSLPVGMGYYELGYTYWRDGDIVDAARWLERGIALMRVELSWGHPVYIGALRDYATFLRQHGTAEATEVVEREIHQAEAKVDVSTMEGRSAGSASLR